jgi:hypothetical protein
MRGKLWADIAKDQDLLKLHLLLPAAAKAAPPDEAMPLPPP